MRIKALINELRWNYRLLKPCDISTLFLLVFAKSKTNS